MDTTHYASTPLETQAWSGRLWAGIFGGFFASLLTFWTLSALGVAIGGHSLSILSMDDLDGIGIAAGIWVMLSAIIAAFVGGYICNRITASPFSKTAMTEGFIVSSLFFLFLTLQSAVGLTYFTTGIANTAGLAAGATEQIIERPEVQNILGRSLDNLDLRAEPEVVFNRVGFLLLNGNIDQAQDYLAAQTGMSAQEINAQVNEISTGIRQAVEEIQDRAGAAMATLGWYSFLTLLFGTAACCWAASLCVNRHSDERLRVRTSGPVVSDKRRAA